MNTFGRIFKLGIFGESHGKIVGVSIDGCPAGIGISDNDFSEDLARRKSGAKGTTPRIESDLPEIVSGLYNGYSTGAPITVLFRNENTKSGDYSAISKHPRPGHADFTASVKFNGFNDFRGGGHFSARLTLGLVAAGVIAKKMIQPVDIQAKLISVHGNTNIEEAIDLAIKQNDSVGGIVECRVSGVPVGLGEPFFDSVESVISHLAFSIPAVKGIEFGSGFQSANLFGSENNDLIINEKGETKTNHSGGINGGITNGNELIFRLAIKPASSISKVQKTFHQESKQIEDLIIAGRHDACVALRAPVIAEAIAAIAIADFQLLQFRNKKK